MEVLVIGDPHFTSRNVDTSDLMISKIDVLITKRNFKFVVVLGDVLHTHEKLHTIALNKALTFFKMLASRCKTFVLVGNHDLINNSQFLPSNHWMNSVKRWTEDITIVDRVVTTCIGEYKFTRLPYVPPGRFTEALNTNVKWVDSDTIFAHQEFKGCRMQRIISKDGDTWSDSLPFVVSGHIHGNQMVGRNVYYSGTPYQTRFGESTDKCVSVLTYKKSSHRPSIEKISLGLPTKGVFKVDSKTIHTFSVPKTTHSEIKLEVSGSIEEFKSFVKSVKYTELLKKCRIVFKTNASPNYNIPSCVNKDDGFPSVLRSLVLEACDTDLQSIYSEFVPGSIVIDEEVELEFEDDSE